MINSVKIMTEPIESIKEETSTPVVGESEHSLNIEYSRRLHAEECGLANSLIRADGCFVDVHYGSLFGDKIKRRFVYDRNCYEVYASRGSIEFREDNKGINGVSIIEHPDLVDIENLIAREFDRAKEFDVYPEDSMIRLSPHNMGRLFSKFQFQEMMYAESLYNDMTRSSDF